MSDESRSKMKALSKLTVLISLPHLLGFFVLLAVTSNRGVCGFTSFSPYYKTTHFDSSARSLLYALRKPQTIPKSFDPFKCASFSSERRRQRKNPGHRCDGEPFGSYEVTLDKHILVKKRELPPLSTAASVGALLFAPSSALAIRSTGEFDPDKFKPVCSTSDTFYRFLQSTTEAIVGKENYNEYGPLIAGGLLRIRLELCVVESFFNEAVGPFIKDKGLSWILPLHETVETFIAGTIFALATTFILVGSTKIVTVIVTYFDIFVGVPSRLFGGFAFDRSLGKPVTLDVGLGPWKKRLVGPPKDEMAAKEDGKSDLQSDLEKVSPAALPAVAISGAVKGVGETSKFTREIFEALDLFIGRYLVLIATGYIGLKFLHFKIFPDFPF
uniref:Uncharacterized protein n=1 Tax=Corethron hystrix TaxID=216773 RepID=A0A7S1B5M9_9STRA|mmetsp:Transcript_13937/g.30620  ORF Transcript_13937/g.30620 Transcript_13937/m.30620 type:complete len:385 (+) Transcript_13937:49-1203(+)